MSAFQTKSKTEGKMVFRLANESLTLGRNPILHGIDLEVRSGEKIALIGPSGAGKTSLLNLLYQQQPGQVALQPQQTGLVDLLSTYQNIFMGALDRVATLPALWNLVRPLAQHRAEIEKLAETLGLSDKLWQSVDRLSGGQRQRVAIGRALYRRQSIFLGDEPVSAVDPLQAKLLLEHLLDQHETAVVSLHNRQLALEHFDRLVIVVDGRIVCDAPAASLNEAKLDSFYQQDPTPEPPAEPAPAGEWAISGS
ncbi:ATP-binding cassette domain-containing protein [Marinobacterium lutimaris]|uniref:Phosphonate transport system ATP-binding protein n=1 Tax=Marinobacterium lutimaris TaxID=568106 RepID=A0A1H5Y5D8_9GAMM|nr:ATP-binding cassette domain-containing protein [Marinobacterium lutimaris]SEG19173.1 phosphonate transport system ATP-binding protein [Marinobacterium lutimaris]